MDTEIVKEGKARVGWNWGAFMMPFQFGVGNKAYLCLLALIPLLNIIWMFMSDFNGARWAYESGEFNTVAEFNASMKTWNRAGLITFIVGVVSLVVFFALCFAIAYYGTANMFPYAQSAAAQASLSLYA